MSGGKKEKNLNDINAVPAMNLKNSHSEMLSVGLLAEYTRTPSNRSSAVLTEVRHCITYNWPEPTIHGSSVS